MQNAFEFNPGGKLLPSILNAFCIQDLEGRFENMPQCGSRTERILGPRDFFLLLLERDRRNSSECLAEGRRSLISAIRVISRKSG